MRFVQEHLHAIHRGAYGGPEPQSTFHDGEAEVKRQFDKHEPAELAEWLERWANRLSDGTVAVNLSPADAQTIIKALRSYPSAVVSGQRPEEGSLDDFVEMCNVVADIVNSKTKGDAVGHLSSYRKRVREGCMPSHEQRSAVAAIQEHNKGCLEACGKTSSHQYVRDSRRCDERRDCPDCPKDWLIEWPSSTERTSSPDSRKA
jgi:hypothetical protein